MNLILERRAEIALRSLRGADRTQVMRALDELQVLDGQELRQRHSVQKVSLAGDNSLFIAIGGKRLRLVLSLEGELCRVLDILNHDRLTRLLRERGAR